MNSGLCINCFIYLSGLFEHIGWMNLDRLIYENQDTLERYRNQKKNTSFSDNCKLGCACETWYFILKRYRCLVEWKCHLELGISRAHDSSHYTDCNLQLENGLAVLDSPQIRGCFRYELPYEGAALVDISELFVVDIRLVYRIWRVRWHIQVQQGRHLSASFCLAILREICGLYADRDL